MNINKGSSSFELCLGQMQVGTLQRAHGEWIFAYSTAFQEQSQFAPITNFPRKERTYRSQELWPFFALRIPSVSQVQVQTYLRERRDETPDAVDLMQQFGLRTAANPFVLNPCS